MNHFVNSLLKGAVAVLLFWNAGCSEETPPWQGVDIVDAAEDSLTVDSGRDAAVDTSGQDTQPDSGIDAADSEFDSTPFDADVGAADVDAADDAGQYPDWWTNANFTNEFDDFDRQKFDPVMGWILLDSDRSKVLAAIEAAAGYGVNHIQLSHDIIMDVDELLTGDQAAADRAETINQATAVAHQKGMKVFLWAHEFQSGDIVVCYGPEGAIWEKRRAAYRAAFEKVPDVDGIVLMFGSAGASPWYTLCDCEWCSDTFSEEMNPPPQDVRIQLVVEQIGIELQSMGKSMIARVFAHEPDENPWHADGLARARGVEFTSMHKSEVGDWQPYNPHDPTLGRTGLHPAVLEMDAAGEYFGRSILPFASPTYYRYRLKHSYDLTGIGAVVRIERGSDRAIGTPNEVNLKTIQAYVFDETKSIDDVWSEFIVNRYGVSGDNAATLAAILESSLTVMTKTHYVMGLWALEKGSDIPEEPLADQLSSRGNMPKWDPDWTDIYEKVRTPDRSVLLDIIHEGTESMIVAQKALESFQSIEWTSFGMSQADADDLTYRLKHQAFAARAWRGVETVIFGARAAANDTANADEIRKWVRWGADELETTADEMENAGLGTAGLASPARIRTFVANSQKYLTADEVTEPPPLTVFPISFSNIGTGSVTVHFDAPLVGHYYVEYGTEFPHFESAQDAVNVLVENPEYPPVGAVISNLQPDTRYIFRIRREVGGEVIYGGDFWAMTRNR